MVHLEYDLITTFKVKKTVEMNGNAGKQLLCRSLCKSMEFVLSTSHTVSS